MPQRRWLRDALWSALFCAYLILIAIVSHDWYRSEECYNSLREGMTPGEVSAIMEKHGYKLFEGSGNSLEAVKCYRRHKSGPAIGVIFVRWNPAPPETWPLPGGPDFWLTTKNRDSLPEHMLRLLYAPLCGDSD